jgi:hypothetical protein
MEYAGLTAWELCEQLREIAADELSALEEGDLGRFMLLAGERTTFQKRVLQPALDRMPTVSTPREIAEILHTIIGLDRQMSAHLTRMARETSQELLELRQGRTVLSAYGKPGMGLLDGPRLLDQSR